MDRPEFCCVNNIHHFIHDIELKLSLDIWIGLHIRTGCDFIMTHTVIHITINTDFNSTLPKATKDLWIIPHSVINMINDSFHIMWILAQVTINSIGNTKENYPNPDVRAASRWFRLSLKRSLHLDQWTRGHTFVQRRANITDVEPASERRCSGVSILSGHCLESHAILSSVIPRIWSCGLNRDTYIDLVLSGAAKTGK